MDELKKLKDVKIISITEWNTYNDKSLDFDNYEVYDEYVELALDNGQYILGRTNHGGCPSGWCSATWGYCDVTDSSIAPSGDNATVRDCNITIDDVKNDRRDLYDDEDGYTSLYDNYGLKIFTYSLYAGDYYYPGGSFTLYTNTENIK